MQALSTHSFRGPAWVAAVAIGAVCLYLAFAHGTPGLNLWPDFVSGLSGSSLYAGTIAAGTSAFEGNRWTNANRQRLRAGSRASATSRIANFAVIAAPMLVGYLLAVAVVAIVAITTGTYGSPSATWLAAIAAALMVSSAIGYSIGAASPGYWFVAPAVALLFYAAYIFGRALDVPYGIASLFPVITNQDSVFVRHLDTVIGAQVGFFVVVSVLLVLVSGSWARVPEPGFALLIAALALTASASGGFFVASNGQYSSGSNPRDFVCHDGHDVTICLNRGYAAGMNPMLNAIQEMNSKAAGTPLVATRLEQNVEGYGDQPSAGARSLYLEQLANPDDYAFAVYRYVAKYGGSASCAGVGVDDQSLAAITLVDSWLSGYDQLFFGTPPGFEHLQALRAMPEAQAAEWFDLAYPRYASCSLTLADLP